MGKRRIMNRTYILTNVAQQYIDNPDDYVRTFTVQINGKKRNIITYKPDTKGAALRHIHEYFANAMSYCYEKVPNSYAYKKGAGILPCLKQHLESNTFLKTDIHEFFNSIDYENLLHVILEDKHCKMRRKRMALLLKACFYDDHLPIGFVTSPVLSDLYLHNLDKSFMGREDIIYTRYADDFIVSGKDNMSSLEQTKGELEEALAGYGLVLNSKKTYFRTLRQPGDAIHVLGVNLVNSAPEPNRITISDRYIRNVSKDICQFLADYKEMANVERDDKLASINGKIEFIRYFSTSSYNKLEKMVSIKLGDRMDLSRKNICSLVKSV